MRIYVALGLYVQIISPIKWKGLDCDDSKNYTANILQLEVFVCLLINVRLGFLWTEIKILSPNGTVKIVMILKTILHS